jgi:hypothetical protein
LSTDSAAIARPEGGDRVGVDLHPTQDDAAVPQQRPVPTGSALSASAQDSLTPSAAHDPGLAPAVRALEVLLSAAKDDPLPAKLHGHLRTALADLEEFR